VIDWETSGDLDDHREGQVRAMVLVASP